ncbi:DsbC family protein [Cellvibrio japonicus]|uniref:Thiol:disulfide interchange protein n=1 Tax=Cellvibrio japonicus (strain Ueda107) TaxID=498211 RepID=B3PDI0_CELJU|nr:DsbC family protein [Cellvibrio japonicus]ACE85018.1 thiol:disulfide interchange protein DsbC [Cellvibrio japonicus Ueda107]QEI12001.1 DsbC family protein [Cellvibrio japonicus]QEI15575.1 DsbC family protein [Cellvibrio japonicus]QEI19154.1 DsbC family protein [Cellvibrio japonicus]
MINILKNTGFLTGCALVSLVSFLAVPAAVAQEESSSGTLLKRKGPEEVILENLHKARPEIKFGKPRPSPIKGLYQVQVPGGPILYVTPEGDKLIAGELLAIEEGGLVRVEDPYLIAERKKMVSSIDPKSTINFKPKGKAKAVVYVFTDVDCGYCRRLHSQMHTYNENGQQLPGYNDLGIEVRYLAYPRAGIPSPSADKLISAWCAKDKQDALTKLKAMEAVPNATCDNPVATHFQLGGEAGVSGTPALFFPDGKLIPGYLPPAELAKQLGI